MKRTHKLTLQALAGMLLALAGSDVTAQTLPVTAGLQLWLKADAGITTNTDGAVTSWADQSGNANDALQPDAAKAPTLEAAALNGKPALRFPGSTKYLDVASSTSLSGLVDDFTVLVVAKYDDLTGGYRCVAAKTLGNNPAPFDWWNTASVNSGQTHLWLGNGTATENKRYVSTAAPTVGSYNVMGFKVGGGTVEQYLNDINNGVFALDATLGDAGTPLRLGSRGDLVTQLKGNLAEVLIYQPALSPENLTAVIGYLRAKYALAFNLPPSVAIATPANGASVAALAPLTVNVQATDPDGRVARVDLLNRGRLVARWTSGPFQVTLNGLNPGVVNLLAIATDDQGRAATSAPVVVNITGSAPSIPVASGLKVWLRADAGVTTNTDGLVTTWADQSGSANDAVSPDLAYAPVVVPSVVNGKSTLRFGPNGLTSDQYMEVADSGTAFTTGDFTTFVMARFTDFATYRVAWTKTPASGLAGPLDVWFQPGTGLPHAYRGDGTSFGGPVVGTSPVLAGEFATIGLACNGTTVSHYLGFADNGAGTIEFTPADAGMALRIGRRADGVTQMLGDIGEILIYDHALSATDRSNVVSYINTRFGLAEVIIGNQPPQVSITSPTNGTACAIGTTTFAASAVDTDGAITRVDLLANGSLVASLTNSPYQIPLDLLTPGTVTLLAVAADNWGLQATSAPVVLTVSGTGPTSPPTNDLRLWLRADNGVQAATDGTVTLWSDRSSNGNDASPGATSPVLVPNVVNGKPAVRFDGVDNALQVPSSPSVALAGDFATYAIVRVDDFATYRAIWGKTVGWRPGSIDLYLMPNNGVPRLFRGDAAGNYGFIEGGKSPTAGAVAMVGAEMAGNQATLYLNGVANGSGQINIAQVDGGAPLWIGTRDDLFTKLKGDLAELLIFGHALSESDRTEVAKYLGAKYGLSLVKLGNQPPTVALTAPTNGTTVVAPGTLAVAAEVTDPDSAIGRVDFYADSVLIGSVTNPPYSLSLQVSTPGTLALQAQAVDAFGAIGQSATVHVTVTGTGPSAPPTAGLVLWLRADVGVVTNSDGSVYTWTDQSSSANNAVQPDPNLAPLLVVDAVTGKNALQFDGTGKYLDVASVPSLVIEGNLSSFCAVDPDDVAAAGTLWSKTQTGRAYPWNYYLAGGGSDVITRGNSDGEWGVGGTTPLATGRSAVIGFSIDGSYTTHYRNGRANGTGMLGYGAADAGGPLRIGLRDDSLNPLKAKLGEVLVYNRTLSESEAQQANGYLAGKYGVVVVALAVNRPTLSLLRVGDASLQLSWPSGFSGYVLESRSDIATGAWTPIATNPPGNTVTLSVTTTAQFFRLRSQ